MLLAIDSSAGASAALIDRGQVVAAWSTPQTTSHAEVLAGAVRDVLAEVGAGSGAAAGAALSGVVVGVGPGPFTGLRVGLALAQSLVCAWDIPLHGVCSLDSIARRGLDSGAVEGDFVVATDARRREVYWGVYSVDGRSPGPRVGPATEVPALPVIGSGAGLYPDELRRGSVPDEALGWLPDAAELGVIAEDALRGESAGAALLPPRPLYLRESDAKVPARMRGAGA